MSFAEVVPTLLALPRSDKLRVVEWLTNELATHSESASTLQGDTSYPVFTPEFAPGAVDVLAGLLQQRAAHE